MDNEASDQVDMVAAMEAAILTRPMLAREMGASYAALQSWRDRRRTPLPRYRPLLAEALERHATRLLALAEQLRRS